MKYLLLSLQYLPHVLNAVSAVEAVAGNKPGADKKAIVLGALQTAAMISGQVDNPTVQLISHLIDSTVTNLNKAGVFTTTKPTTQTASGNTGAISIAGLQNAR